MEELVLMFSNYNNLAIEIHDTTNEMTVTWVELSLYMASLLTTRRKTNAAKLLSRGKK